ncbi:MAG: alkaline phosphatase family protein [Candidatus Omnitrophica bacterium]|jgi:predicted AlkP superfamily phosphohydrolase/phosphomutase|nr:alkaline phosphatase family protein [Candidatus Omnitrophota bacterium]MDD5505860.1 alkaline phosphatase family protein [Candidatus Omnitrophota bacterium]
MKITLFLGYIDPGNGFTFFSLGTLAAAFLAGALAALLFFLKKTGVFLKQYKKPVILLVLILLVFGLTIKGVMMSRQLSRFNQKVVILGFDALSPEIIDAMLAKGKLANFARLKGRGSYALLATTNPAQSPVAWSALATGRNPGKNGVFDFIIRDPKTYRLDLVFSQMKRGQPQRALKGKCFWQYTSQALVPATIINCPATFPPDKIYGKMLSGMGVPDILGTEGTFTFYTSGKIDLDKPVGGKVFQVKKSPVMLMNFIGPRKAGLSGRSEYVKVPFRARQKDKDSLIIEYQNKRTEIKAGQWSDWQEVVFNLGILKKARGICKFYLLSTEPELKLYITPVNFDPRQPLFRIAYPASYSKELAGKLGLYHTQGMPMDTWAVNEGRLPEEAFLQQAGEIQKEKEAMLELELSRLKKGVLFCYFEYADIIQHMFWRNVDGRHKDVIEKAYAAMDKVLGTVLDKLDKDDTLIVLSDHGFGAFKRAAHLNSWLRKNGYLALKDNTADSGDELLADIDWSKTRAYAIGFGAIYINQQGREGAGIVMPGRETEDLKEEIAGKLTGWMDEKYNQPVIHKVYKREQIFRGKYIAEAPDLYVGFNKGYRASWQTAIGGAPRALIEDNLKKWSGDHLFDPSLVPGVIFSNRKICKEKPSIYDIAPTVLKITGYSEAEIKACDFDGEPLF